jgi:MscS family membrane protein
VTFFLSIFNDGTLDLTGRQYLGLAVIVATAVLAQSLYLATATLYIRGHNSPARRTFWRGERRRVDGVIFGTFLALAFLIGIKFIELDTDVEDTVSVAARVLGAVCGGMLLLRGIAIVGDYLLEKAGMTATRLDDQLIPLVRQTANVFVVLVGSLFVLSNLDVDVAALIAGLGIGGLAVALAAQDTIKNLLGGVTVLADRPFQVGDWIVVGGVEGTVEKIGFRSMRIEQGRTAASRRRRRLSAFAGRSPGHQGDRPEDRQ